MNLLVSGATGFLGRHFCDILIQVGATAQVLSRRPVSLPQNFSVIRHDFGSDDELSVKVTQPVDAVVHMAHAMGSSREEQMAFATKSTRALLDYGISHQVKTFVLVSSLSVLDLAGLPAFAMVNNHTRRLVEGGHLPPYVAAKLAQELLVEHAALESGINAVILRPGLIYDDSVMSTSCAGLFKGSLQIAISHEGQIPLVSARRTAEEILKAVVSFNAFALDTRLVLDEHPWSMQSYRDALIEREHIKSNVVAVPWWMMNFIGSCADMFASSFNYREQLPDLFIQPSRSARLKPLMYWPVT